MGLGLDFGKSRVKTFEFDFVADFYAAYYEVRPCEYGCLRDRIKL